MRLYSLLNAVQKSLKAMPISYYAVARGRKPGVYTTWDECKEQVHQYSGPVFKKFPTQAQAEEFIKNCTNSTDGVSDGKSMESKSSVAKAPNSVKKDKSLLTDAAKLSTGTKRSMSTSSCSNVQLTKLRKLGTRSISCMLSDTKDNQDFIIDEDGYVNVYTDGACSSNGRKNARAGIGVWFGDNHALNVSRAVDGRATNNMAEIQAVTVAALQAKKAGVSKLKINTDSKFLISCITQWMPKWKANGWKTVENKPVTNKVELIEMENALDSLTVGWNHVNGHVGIYGNEMADRLARAGCLEY